MMFALVAAATALLFLLTVWKPSIGIDVLFAEAILGGNGRWLELMGGALTPRYFIFVAVFGGWTVHKILTGMQLARVRMWFLPLLFGCVLAFGVIHARQLGNNAILGEAQVWLYLLVYPIIVDLNRREHGYAFRLLRRVIVWIFAMTLVQLVIMVSVNTLPAARLVLRNVPLTRMRIVVADLGAFGFFTVFWGNCAIATIAVAVPFLLLSARGQTPLFKRSGLWTMAILASVGLVGTWTRGIWGQLVAVLVMVAIDYFWRGKLPLRIIVGIAMMIALGIGGIAWFPAARQSFVSRFEKLLPSERAGLDPTDSIVVKATERENLRKAIATRPWSGFGFGEGDFHQFGLEEASRFHNFFLGFALKTGWIGMAILLAMLFAICWRAFRIGLRRSSGRSGLVLRGIVYALFWGMAASTSNPHIATPAFILSIGLLMALTDVTERASLVARVRYRIHENKHLRRQLQFDAAP